MTELRALGVTGLSVAPLVVGGNVFGWTADEPTSFAILDAFADPTPENRARAYIYACLSFLASILKAQADVQHLVCVFFFLSSFLVHNSGLTRKLSLIFCSGTVVGRAPASERN